LKQFQKQEERGIQENGRGGEFKYDIFDVRKF
jgi:hypothetical protein